jgi:hypothetical protein
VTHLISPHQLRQLGGDELPGFGDAPLLRNVQRPLNSSVYLDLFHPPPLSWFWDFISRHRQNGHFVQVLEDSDNEPPIPGIPKCGGITGRFTLIDGT